LVVLEDTPELQVSVENAVILKTTDTVSLQDLVKTTLRLRPDRIVVGEVRGGETLALLKAWNTGHPGGVATIHANHAEAGLHRMAQLIAEVTPTPMHTLIAEAVQLVVFLEKTPTGRKVTELKGVNGFVAGQFQLQDAG
jgi:type IV secretion system protein TrbB